MPLIVQGIPPNINGEGQVFGACATEALSLRLSLTAQLGLVMVGNKRLPF